MNAEADWAEVTAQALLAPLGSRWQHVLGVAERARSFRRVLPVAEVDVLIAAAYVHDVGYAPELAITGFHPLDGAEFLRQVGRERLACLVAYHSGARVEADERGLADLLSQFSEEESLVARALTYCDVTTGPEGECVDVATRLADVAARYGTQHPAGRMARRLYPDLVAGAEAIESVLRAATLASSSELDPAADLELSEATHGEDLWDVVFASKSGEHSGQVAD